MAVSGPKRVAARKSGRARGQQPAPAPPLPAVLLRGNSLATVDDSGRLKLPAGFRRLIDEALGPRLYLTSLLGDSLWVYPLGVWQEKEKRILGLSSQHPSV